MGTDPNSKPLSRLGRGQCLDALRGAFDRARAGERVLATVIGTPGSGVTTLLDMFADEASNADFEVRRTEAFAAQRSDPGHVAEELRIEASSPGRAVLIVDGAQWADATSIAVLRELLAAPGQGLLVVAARIPSAGQEITALAEMEDAMHRRGARIVVNVAPLSAGDLDPIAAPDLARGLIAATGGSPERLQELVADALERSSLRWEDGRLVGSIPAEWERTSPQELLAELGPDERRLAEAAALAGRPIPLGIAAQILGIAEHEALAAAERIESVGLARGTAQGLAAIQSVAAEISAGMGEMRRGATFGALAEAFAAGGVDARDRAVVGGYFAAAGRHDKALPLLAAAGIEAADKEAFSEALPVLESAVEAYGEAGSSDRELEGRLRLARAKCYRYAGWSGQAAADVEVATRHLSGEEAIHAHGWAAQIVSDLQLLQDAERHLAAGEYLAATTDREDMRGSLLTLRARVLSRLGFPFEADWCLDRGRTLVDTVGDPGQRSRARYNAGWIHFDRGRATEAERDFAGLVEASAGAGDPGRLADVEAWWARTLFMSGRPVDALDTAATALRHADEAGDSGPVFVTHLALSEGFIAFRRGAEALHASDELLALVLAQFAAWENVARHHRSQALLLLGRLDEAAEEIERALASCPAGIDGWRWRLRCRAQAMLVAAARGEDWRAKEADQLTEELLNGRWHLPAILLLTERSVREKDKELARRAVALAVRLGLPVEAAAAAEAGGLWDEPTGIAAAAGLRQITVPADWEETWATVPFVAAARTVPETSPEEYTAAAEEIEEELTEALDAAGLSSDRLMSPAQRRAAGLKIRRPRRRRSGILAGAAGGVVAAVVAVVATLAVASDPAPPTTLPTIPTTTQATTTTTTTTIVAVEDRLLEPLVIEDGLAMGQWDYRGGPARRGLAGDDVTGVSEVGGYLWKSPTVFQIEASPVTHGRKVFVGTLGGDFYIFDTLKGTVNDVSGVDEPVVASAALGSAIVESDPVLNPDNPGAVSDTGTTRAVSIVVFAEEDGTLWTIRAQDGSKFWDDPIELGSGVESAPLVVDGIIYVGTVTGELIAVDASSRAEVWRYPQDGAADNDPVLSPAHAEGRLFIAHESGRFASLDPADGSVLCENEAQGDILADPVVARGLLYTGGEAQALEVFDLNCGFESFLPLGANVVTSPAVLPDGKVVVGNNAIMIAVDLTVTEGENVAWGARAPCIADSEIKSSPVAANGIVYFGTRNGLFAVSADDGTCLWTFSLDSAIESSPAIVDGAVFFTTLDGFVYAVAEDTKGWTTTP